MRNFSNPKLNKFVRDYDYRTKIFFYCSIVFTIAFAVFNAALGLYYSSIWYGSIAIYLIVLALQRIFVLIHIHILNKVVCVDGAEREKAETILYLVNGIVILFLFMALSFSIIQMVTSIKPIIAGTIIAITTATYTFYKITMSVINLFRAKKANDKIIQTIRNINFVDALVSMLTLTVSLLATFGENHDKNKPMIISVAVGVSVMIVTIGITMIVNGTRDLKSQKNENTTLSESVD